MCHRRIQRILLSASVCNMELVIHMSDDRNEVVRAHARIRELSYKISEVETNLLITIGNVDKLINIVDTLVQRIAEVLKDGQSSPVRQHPTE
jgi:hypothetical protein